ncbi:hypothetical protein [Colwellia chukchiensis]|nr:hypothetical protein [Colwellia chukchiensis]
MSKFVLMRDASELLLFMGEMLIFNACHHYYPYIAKIKPLISANRDKN